MPSLPKAILLDLDDTIIAFDTVSRKSWLAAASEISQNLDGLTSEELVKSIQEHARAFWSDPVRHRKWRQNLVGARQIVVEQTFLDLGILDQELAINLARRFSEIKEEALYLFPGAVDAIKKMRDLGIRLALVTNGSSHSQRLKIERFSLGGFFDQILIEGEQGIGKPDPVIYKRALSLLSVEANDTWMIGDNIIWDVIAPQGLGIKGIWIRDPLKKKLTESTGKPFLEIERLSEIEKYLN